MQSTRGEGGGGTTPHGTPQKGKTRHTNARQNSTTRPGATGQAQHNIQRQRQTTSAAKQYRRTERPNRPPRAARGRETLPARRNRTRATRWATTHRAQTQPGSSKRHRASTNWPLAGHNAPATHTSTPQSPEHTNHPRTAQLARHGRGEKKMAGVSEKSKNGKKQRKSRQEKKTNREWGREKEGRGNRGGGGGTTRRQGPRHPGLENTERQRQRGRQKETIKKSSGTKIKPKDEGKAHKIKKNKPGGQKKGKQKTNKKEGGGGTTRRQGQKGNPGWKTGNARDNGGAQKEGKQKNKKHSNSRKQGNPSPEGAEQTKSAPRPATGDGEAHQNRPGRPARPTRPREASTHTHTHRGCGRGVLRPSTGGFGVHTKQPRCNGRVPRGKTGGSVTGFTHTKPPQHNQPKTDARGTCQGQPHRGARNGYDAERAQCRCLGSGQRQAQ